MSCAACLLWVQQLLVTQDTLIKWCNATSAEVSRNGATQHQMKYSETVKKEEVCLCTHYQGERIYNRTLAKQQRATAEQGFGLTCCAAVVSRRSRSTSRSADIDHTFCPRRGLRLQLHKQVYCHCYNSNQRTLNAPRSAMRLFATASSS